MLLSQVTLKLQFYVLPTHTHLLKALPFTHRIARHQSGRDSMELFRVPEDKLAELDKIIEKQPTNDELVAAASSILPADKLGEPYCPIFCSSKLTDSLI